jgi:RND family efflux transporter MFP subunit
MHWPRAWVLVAAGLALASCNGKDASSAKPPLLVRAQAVKIEDYAASLALTGEIQARVQTDLAFRVSGRILERDADVGQHVSAGAVLAKIDPSEQHADLDAANAAVVAAEALTRQTSAAFERQQALMASGFATRSNFDQAQQALRTAQGSLDAAKAQAASAKEALSYTELRAERAGVVTARAVEVGQVAQAAQAAFTIAEDGPRDAVFSVYESMFFLRPASDVVRLSLVSDPSVVAAGRVREVAPSVDPRTGTVRVKVGVDDPPPQMSLGAPVAATGEVAPGQAVFLPWSAAASQDGALAVWVVDPATHKTSLRRVEAQAYEKERIVIDKGLKAGELVVTAGAQFLFPGATVSIAEAAP